MRSASASEDRARRFRSSLYPLYHRGAALNHFFRGRIRPPGTGLLILGLIMACLAGGQASDPIFRLFSFAVVLGVLSLGCLPWRRVSLEVRREVPRYATVGEPLPVCYELRHGGRRRLRHAWLVEAPPDGRPEREHFLGTPEPGEATRNGFDRLFAYYRWSWLWEMGRVYDARPSWRPIDVAAGGTARVRAELMPRRRGVAVLDELRVLLPDPLGFFQRSVRVGSDVTRVAVLPRRYRLPELVLPGAQADQPVGEKVSRQSGLADEFIGLRDYRPGDPQRLIHWRSWARTGRPLVRELEDSWQPRHGLVLDTYPEGGDVALFEEAVSVAASFVAGHDAEARRVDRLLIAGREAALTTAGGDERVMLEALAGVAAAREGELEELRRLVLSHAGDLAGWVVVMAGWSAARGAWMRALQAAGIELAVLVIDRALPTALPAGVHGLRLGSVAEDLQKLPTELGG